MRSSKNIHPAAARVKAEKRRARRRTAKRTMFGALALFFAVFSLLSYRLTFGLDPSTVSAVQTAGVATGSQPVDDDSDGDDEESYESGDDDDSWFGSPDSSTSMPSQPPAQTQPQQVPQTRAS